MYWISKFSIVHAVICSSLLFVPFYGGCAVNPLTGEQELMLIPEDQDIALGRQYAPEIEKQLGGRIPNRPIQNYIDEVGQKIVVVSHKRPYQYHFIALNDPMVNAFALPGGYIFITRGMLEVLSTEAQLAAILGHEVSHVVARDTAALMSREIGIDILMGVALGDSASQGVEMAAGMARQIIGLSYSRKQESTADYAGMRYMYKAGYNPYGMVETMAILQEHSGGAPPEFLSSHPDPGNRQNYLTDFIQSNFSNVSGMRVGEDDYKMVVTNQLKSLGDQEKQEEEAPPVRYRYRLNF
jgi:predicted Zn-dependent protease